MRVALICIVIALSLTIHGIECNVNNNLHLSNSAVTIDTYKSFIKNISQSLSGGYYSQDNVPIMRPSAPDSELFYLFDLTSDNDETITVAADVVDASIAAYRAGSRSYFFPNAPRIAQQILFNDTAQNTMDFNNTFSSLENAAGITRSRIPLGKAPFNSAITLLYHHEFVPESLLVIIQMVIEASKFRFIKQHVVNSLRDGNEFLPSPAILSLEDNWSELSFQMQASASLQGLFGKEVLLYNSNDEPIKVDSIYYPIVHANLVFELYTCLRSTKQEDINNIIIKMPGSVKDDTQQNNKCKLGPQTVRISGRNGLCVDVESAFVVDGSRVILYPCGQQVNKKWTFYPDYTIRSLGKCLAPSRSGNNIVIYDCDNASEEEIQWEVFSNGRISKFYDDIVLTAKGPTKLSNLTVETNTFAAEQTWRAGNYVKPFIVSIVGLNDMCLEATNGNNDIWLEDCVKNKEEQSWALYSDGTIRVNQNRSLCVASSTDASSKVVAISSCNGSNNERWIFVPDGTVLNGRSKTMMDVAQSNVNLKKIIVHPANGKANQQWVLLY